MSAHLAAAHTDFAMWFAARQGRPLTYVDTSGRLPTLLVEVDKARVDRLCAAADRLRGHEFDLLGSGPYVPVDASRRTAAYTPIDWHLDPVAQCRFPAQLRQDEWTPAARPPGADIKRPWELGRCQHWVPLAQAGHLTGRAEYADEVAQQLLDFVAANPVGFGVNWACTMDVAIRAANWCVAFDLLRTAPPLTPQWWSRAYAALFDHGVFIESHLENTYEVTSNHFLSDVVGLMFVGAAFADLPQGRRWLTLGREWLEREIQVQVLADGADYESSIPYHRLVTELFLGGARLALHVAMPMPAAFTERLRQMVQLLGDVLRPDGWMPQVGDADDGRLHILTDYGGTPQDPRHIFGAAAAAFDDVSYVSLGGDVAWWEAAWWGAPVTPAVPRESRPAVHRLFPHAGIAVGRGRDIYLLITNGVVGTAGFGNHKHNDQLGFEFHCDGHPLLVDPGTFVYTADAAARNLFRSTAMHNTLRIDDVEQNEFNPEWLFRMFPSQPPEHTLFETTTQSMIYRGRHFGYRRLPAPVAHERTFKLSHRERSLEVVDVLEGTGGHELTWHFHFAPDVTCQCANQHVQLHCRNQRYLLEAPAGLQAVALDTWYSPSYGRRYPCQAIEFRTRVTLPSDHEWKFLIRPA